MNQNFQPRPRRSRTPYGYVDYNDFLERGGDPNLYPEIPEELRRDYIFPLPEVLEALNKALDQLDAGISLREASTWLDANTPDDFRLSHAGLAVIRDRDRPYKITKLPKPNNLVKKTTKMTRQERQEYNRKVKIAADKRSLIATEKRIERTKEELSILQGVTPASPSIITTSSSAEMEVPEEKDDVVFRPNDGPQSFFLSASEREVLYGGAAGGGKSYALLADPIRYFDNPNFNGLLLRRTNDELRELIWKSRELYQGLYGKEAKWSERKSSWTFPAGGHLWFTYLERDEDVMRYQGQAFTWIGFDELTQYPTPFSWNYLRSRLRTTDPELRKHLSMRGTTNPGGPGHGWVKRMFIDPAPAGKAFVATDIDTNEPLVYPKGHEREGQPLFYRRFIPAKVSDNPYLWADGTYEANLLSLPENQRRRLLDGDWAVAEGAAFPEFRSSLHTCDPFEVPHDWFRFRSCDYGYSERQASAVHWYAVEPSTGTLYVYRELYVNKHTGSELARRVLSLEQNERVSYGVLDSSVWSNRGQTGPTIAEEMIRAGCRWKPSDRSQGSRIASKNRLHELLRIDSFSGKPGIVFFNTCRQIIADLPVIPASKDDDDIDQKYASDHAYDSIRYGIQSRPKSQPWQFDFSHGRSTASSYSPSDPVFGY